MSQQATPAVIEGRDPVAQWGRVVDGFQATNSKLHRAITDAFTLDPAEAETLLRLTRSQDNRMPMAALARDAAFSTGGFTKIADRLAKRSLVHRQPCSEDRRVVYLELTTSGAELAAELQVLAAGIVQESYVDALGPERASMVAEAMSKLREFNGRTI